jgi:hypothetical protein
MNKPNAEHLKSDKCKTCFLSPEICGAKNEQICDKIYDSKWHMRWELFKEFAPIVFLMLFIVAGIASAIWLRLNDIPFFWESALNRK